MWACLGVPQRRKRHPSVGCNARSDHTLPAGKLSSFSNIIGDGEKLRYAVRERITNRLRARDFPYQALNSVTNFTHLHPCQERQNLLYYPLHHFVKSSILPCRYFHPDFSMCTENQDMEPISPWTMCEHKRRLYLDSHIQHDLRLQYPTAPHWKYMAVANAAEAKDLDLHCFRNGFIVRLTTCLEYGPCSQCMVPALALPASYAWFQLLGFKKVKTKHLCYIR